MKPLIFVLTMMLVCLASSAFSGDAPSPPKSADLEEQVNTLTAKLEVLEKRIAGLEKINREQLEALSDQAMLSALERSIDATTDPKLRESIQQSLRHLQEQQQLKEAKKRPKFQLLNHTEIGVPFDVERAMMGDAHRFQQFAPQEQYEFKAGPLFIPFPEVRPIPER